MSAGSESLTHRLSHTQGPEKSARAYKYASDSGRYLLQTDRPRFMCGESAPSGRLSREVERCENKRFTSVFISCLARFVTSVILAFPLPPPLSLSPFPSHLQVVLPLVDQYFKCHRCYFLSTSTDLLGNRGHASNKEKEMVTR